MIGHRGEAGDPPQQSGVKAVRAERVVRDEQLIETVERKLYVDRRHIQAKRAQPWRRAGDQHGLLGDPARRRSSKPGATSSAPGRRGSTTMPMAGSSHRLARSCRQPRRDRG